MIPLSFKLHQVEFEFELTRRRGTVELRNLIEYVTRRGVTGSSYNNSNSKLELDDFEPSIPLAVFIFALTD